MAHKLLNINLLFLSSNCIIFPISSNCYDSFNKYISVSIITLTIDVVFSTQIIVYFSPIFSSKLIWMVNLVYCLKKNFFLIFHYYCYYIDIKSSIIFCIFSRDIYFSFGSSLTISMFSVSFGTFIITRDSLHFSTQVFSKLIIFGIFGII